MGRFFSGKWASNHGDAVERALQSAGDTYVSFSHGPDPDLMDEKDHKIYKARQEERLPRLIRRVMEEIGDNPIKQDGDLQAILNTIEAKTGIKAARHDQTPDVTGPK